MTNGYIAALSSGDLSGHCDVAADTVHIRCFFIRDVQFNAAQGIYRLSQCIEVNGYIFLNVQIQVAVEHLNGFLRSAMIVCIITFTECLITIHIQTGITVNRYQFYFLGVVVNAADHDAVTVTGIIITGRTVVHTKQGNRRIVIQKILCFFIQIICL